MDLHPQLPVSNANTHKAFSAPTLNNRLFHLFHFDFSESNFTRLFTFNILFNIFMERKLC